MNAARIPARWPRAWTDASPLALVRNTPVDCVVMEAAGPRDAARAQGLQVVDPAHPPAGVEIVKGERPGVRNGRHGEAGPTGAPWVDSNGWLIRLSRWRAPAKTIWISADPAKSNEIVAAKFDAVACADAMAYGGRWIAALDGGWKDAIPVLRFYAAHPEWASYPPKAVLGVISDFEDFLGQEVLNLTARLHQPYRISSKPQPDLRGLVAVIYPDAKPPSDELRRSVMGFVEAGGLLVAGPQWEKPSGDRSHPRFAARQAGKGRVAVWTDSDPDPYQLAADTQVLMSHRHDLVRFWNPGSMGSYLTQSPNGALLHVVNYAGRLGADAVTVWVAGPYRTAKLHTPDGVSRLTATQRQGGAEVNLPSIPICGALELE